MKFINSRFAVLLLALFVSVSGTAQEIIKDTIKPKTHTAPKGKAKVDGVVSVVGDYVVLESDIDLQYKELQAQNISTEGISRCELLGKLMEDKLYAHQAIQDSIVVSDAEVNEQVNRRVDYFVEQLGSKEKMVEYFKKKDFDSFQTELFDMVKVQELTDRMRKKVIDDVEITPEEVRQFFMKFQKEDIPVFGAEMEVAQIVIKPEITKEEKQKVIDRLKQIKKDVQDGSSFYSKAVLYSEDRGSGSAGGFIPVTRKSQLVKEFKDTAFSTDEGQISEPFETEYGFHIIFVEKIRGQERDVRHILMVPKVTADSKKAAKEKIEKIRERIKKGEISFAEVARSESNDKETRNSGGLLINPQNLGTRFELTKMDPNIYNEISGLKNNEVSDVVEDTDRLGVVSFKLYSVTNRYDEHPADYAQDYIKIKELALKEKQIKTIAKWSDEKIKATFIKVSPDYVGCKFANNWLKK
jgi:peptidyl-prolyl cis-trans isomerase SurA